MLNELKIDELLEKVDSRYGLVLAGARRARQINEYTATLGLNDTLGIPGPQVHTRSQHPLTIAIEELREGKLEVGFRKSAEEEEAARSQATDPGSTDEEVAETTATAEDGASDPGEEGQGAA